MSLGSDMQISGRSILITGGILGVLAGLVLLAAPGTLRIGSDRALVLLVGVVGLLGALREILRSRRRTFEETSTPDVEKAIRTPRPGDVLESLLRQFTDADRIYFYRKRLRSALGRSAVAVLTHFRGQTRSEAEAAIEDGTWTADPYAAAFLGRESGGFPLRDRLRDTLSRTPPFERDVSRTLSAIANVGGIDPPEDESGNIHTNRSLLERTEAENSGPATTDDLDPDRFDNTPRETGQWRGVSVVALLCLGVGILSQQPAILLSGVLGIGYVAYARAGVFGGAAVSIDRSLSVSDPEPGDAVAVTLTVSNTGTQPIPDLRIIDGVPEAMAVEDGSPRLGTALRPGEETTIDYSMIARRGLHRFQPTVVISRDLSGTDERAHLEFVDTEIVCIPSLETLDREVPLRGGTSQSVGLLEGTRSGPGIEFHSVREYRPGDSPSRIDWRRSARTGELTTLEFQEEHAATVILVIDARPSAYLSADDASSHAVDRSVDAAGTIAATLLRSGNRVGLAAVSPEDCWLGPGAGSTQRTRLRQRLATHDALSPVPAQETVDLDSWIRRLRKRLPDAAQILFFSPLCGEDPERLPRVLEAAGHPVTVLSPDPTSVGLPATRLATVARRLEIARVRSSGIPVIDWAADERLSVALDNHRNRRGL